MEDREEIFMEKIRVEIYDEIAAVLAEERLIAPEEKVRFLELMGRSGKAWQRQ